MQGLLMNTQDAVLVCSQDDGKTTFELYNSVVENMLNFDVDAYRHETLESQAIFK